MLVRRAEAKEFGFHGVTVADYGATAEGTASVAMVDVSPGRHHPFAYSSRCEKLYLVMAGEVRVIVDGVLYRPKVQDLVIVPKGKVFRYENEGDGAARMLLAHVPAFDPEAEHLLPDRMREHEVHLRGERVALRPMTEEDWEDVLAWNGDPEVLKWAEKAGCRGVLIGFESINQESLRTMDKARNLRVGAGAYKNLVKRIHDHGMVARGTIS